jgi:YgiT-type zinc finger domain-containing protein
MKQHASRLRCPTCGKLGMKRVLRTIQTSLGRRRISVPGIEVEECTNCGERLYDLNALRLIKRAREPSRRGSAA